MARTTTSACLHPFSLVEISTIRSLKNSRHHRGQIHQLMAMQYDALKARGDDFLCDGKSSDGGRVMDNVIALDCV